MNRLFNSIINWFKKKNKNDLIFFTVLFAYIIWIFKKAFLINFFVDDYFFLKISRAKNIVDFLNFFSPIREHSYKPLASETFYFILHLFNTNAFLGHIIAFVTFFIGLIFLYKIIKLLTKNILLARLSVFLYGTSFTHVFQLYWFATFQEIALFTFLTISFYCFLKNKYLVSIIFFVLASLCKETASLYAPFLLLFIFVINKGNLKKIKREAIPLIIILVVTFFFWLIYRYGLHYVTELDNYKMDWNIKLLLNNGIWYWLWGAGFPNFMPDYFPSIFSKPLSAFWTILDNQYAKNYFYLLIIYLFLLFISLVTIISLKVKELKKYLLIIVYCLINFFVFLGPILFFRHKWMIRLTLPLIFISLAQSLIISLLLLNRNKYVKYFGLTILLLYSVWNYFGINVHEQTSIYLLENNIYINAKNYFDKNKLEVLKYDIIYFKDTTHNLPTGWNGSEKLKLSFSGNNFLDHFFPNKKIKAIYSFENKIIPEKSYVIDSNILLK